MKTYMLLLAIFLFLISSVLKAQKTFTKEIQYPGDVQFNYIILTADDNIIAATGNPDDYPSRGLYLTKLNLRGSLFWSKKYLYNDNDITILGTILIPSQSNGFIALSHVGTAIRSHGDLLIKADSSGNILWAKQMDRSEAGSQITPIGVAEAGDGAIYVATQIYDKGIHIQKFDKDANPLWSRYVKTDTLQSIFTRYETICATTDNGLIFSTITSEVFGSRYYSHMFKLSADGVPEWEYSPIKNTYSSNYIYGINTKSNDKINLLYFQDSSYKYVVLNPFNGKSEGWDITSNTDFDLQSFFLKKAINPFRKLSFGSVYSMSIITKKWELVRGSQYKLKPFRFRSRIQKFDSLGRICPDYQTPPRKGEPVEFSFPFTRSSFNLSTSPVTFIIKDAFVTTESVDRIKNICEGEAPDLLASAGDNMLVKNTSDIFNVSPNPTTGYLNIHLNVSADYLSKVFISDMYGRVVQSFTTSMIKGENNKVINITALPTGIYILKCSTANGVVTQKIIKQ